MDFCGGLGTGRCEDRLHAAGSSAARLRLYSIPAGGGYASTLTNHDGPSFSPDFSHDGARIAFSRFLGNWGYDIFAMDADGGDEGNLTANGTADESRPPGRRTALRSPTPGRSDAEAREVFVMDADGDDQTNLTNDPADDFAPAWSPDGTLIAFTRSSGGDAEI